MTNNFSQIMSERSNAELLRIVNEERADYQSEAIEAAEKEIDKRNLSTEQIESATKEIKNKKQIDEGKANEPLGIGWKIFAMLCPGLILILFSKTFSAEGYFRKSKELVRFTLYGLGAYFGLFVLMILIFKLFML